MPLAPPWAQASLHRRPLFLMDGAFVRNSCPCVFPLPGAGHLHALYGAAGPAHELLWHLRGGCQRCGKSPPPSLVVLPLQLPRARCVVERVCARFLLFCTCVHGMCSFTQLCVYRVFIPCVDVRVQDDEGNVIVPPPDASAVEGTIGLQKTPRPLQVCEAPLPHTLSRLPFV